MNKPTPFQQLPEQQPDADEFLAEMEDLYTREHRIRLLTAGFSLAVSAALFSILFDARPEEGHFEFGLYMALPASFFSGLFLFSLDSYLKERSYHQ